LAIGLNKDGLNSKLHIVCDGLDCSLTFFLSPGKMSDTKGALVLLNVFPREKLLLGDKKYDVL
jgi:hypothetical protein